MSAFANPSFWHYLSYINSQIVYHQIVYPVCLQIQYGLGSMGMHEDPHSVYLPGVNMLANAVSQHAGSLIPMTTSAATALTLPSDSMNSMHHTLADYQHL